MCCQGGIAFASVMRTRAVLIFDLMFEEQWKYTKHAQYFVLILVAALRIRLNPTLSDPGQFGTLGT